MKCENCEIEYEIKFGSGRFCSLKCARGFSTKEKRKEINEKVSIKLSSPLFPKGRKNYERFLKICEVCKIEYETKNFRKKCCSKECIKKLQQQKQIGASKPKGEFRKKGSGGLRDGGGRSKVFEYISNFGEKMKLNKEEIQIAKILDNSDKKWNRNTTGFLYDINRKFYPDFYIEDLDLYVEYKGWLTDSMRNKMKNSNIKNLMIVVGNDKRYKNDGISIDSFKIYIAGE